MNQSSFSPTIDEYLRKRLMPVEGAIPQLAGIDMYGNSIPAATVGGDLFEYINFQQRYKIDGRIARALKLAKLYLDPLPAGQSARNMVDDHVCWLENRLNHEPPTPLEYKKAKGSEQLRIAEDLPELKTTARVLLVDAQGNGLISAKIASTLHDTFHALMLVELVTVAPGLNACPAPNNTEKLQHRSTFLLRFPQCGIRSRVRGFLRRSPPSMQ